jgi:hypothetical protein
MNKFICLYQLIELKLQINIKTNDGDISDLVKNKNSITENFFKKI